MPLRDPALIAAGFSLVAALLLAVLLLADRRTAPLDARPVGAAGLLLLAALGFCQWVYFSHLLGGIPPLEHPLYPTALFLAAPAGFMLADVLLRPGRSFRALDAAHLLPPALASLLPAEWAPPLAFGLGAGYLALLGQRLWSLRERRHLFRLEFWWLATLLGCAGGVVLLGLAGTLGRGAWNDLAPLHAIAIGLCFVLALVLALRAPHLLETVAEVAGETEKEYTLLRGLDREALISALERGMRGDGWRLEPGLNLAAVAGRLGLAPHQLSALINQELGLGFSQYLRRLRVERAGRMLRDEPRASVLSVGMAVGFSSQSNFYEAFHEVMGESPGSYRRRVLASVEADEPAR